MHTPSKSTCVKQPLITVVSPEMLRTVGITQRKRNIFNSMPYALTVH